MPPLTDEQRTAFRRDRVGFVFQFFNLVPTLLENVEILTESTGPDAAARSRRALDVVGVAEVADGDCILVRSAARKPSPIGSRHRICDGEPGL